MSPGRRLCLAVLLAAAVWLALQQASLLLTQIQQQDVQAYGIEALGGGLLPKGLTQTAKAAIALWTATDEVHSAATLFVWAYTVIDCLFIVAYVWLLALIMWLLADALGGTAGMTGIAAWCAEPLWRSSEPARWIRRVGPVLWLAIFDFLENLARLAAYATKAGHPSVGSENVYVLAAWFFEKIKFIFLIVVLIAIAAAVRQLRGQEASAEEVPTDPDAGHYWHALVVLRGQVALVLIFAAALLIDVTGQAGDILRRWADGTWAAWGSMLAGIALLGLLVVVLWSSCRRIILARNDVLPAASTARRASVSLWVVAYAALGITLLFLWLFNTRIPWALLVVFILLLFLELTRMLFGLPTLEAADAKAENATAEAAPAPLDYMKTAYQRIARALALVPVAVLGLGLIRSATGPVILSFLPGVGYKFLPFFLMLAGGLVVLLSIPIWLYGMLENWDDRPTASTLEGRHVLLIVVTVVLVALLGARPLVVPPFVGSVGTLTVMLAALGLLFAELQRFSEISVPPQGLTMIGFTRVPVFLLLALWLVVASQFDDGSHHRIRTRAGTPTATTVPEIWSDWMKANCLDSATGPVPLVLVSAEGGGIRAAYWTASVLTDLLGDTPLVTCQNRDARARVLAVSGISGGSVGTIAYLARPSNTRDQWYKRALGEPDYVATPLAMGFVVDLPRSVLGFHAPDRAAWLERAWDNENSGLAEDYFSSLAPGLHAESWTPLTIMNGTQVETGCRVNTSAVRLATDGTQTSTDCRSITARKQRLDLPQSAAMARSGPTPAQSVPAAPITVDILNHTCDKSFAASTAALLSARFPYITPSGQLPCNSARVHVVDGGYGDGTGMAAIMDLWAQVEPFVASRNAKAAKAGGKGMVVPLLVHIDNHYQSSAKLRPPARTPELLVPQRTRSRATATRDPGRKQQAGAAFIAGIPGAPSWRCDLASLPEISQTGEVLLAPQTRPGLPAPLAWTLAMTSRQDLDKQRSDLFAKKGTSLRAVLTGQTPISCTDASTSAQ